MPIAILPHASKGKISILYNNNNKNNNNDNNIPYLYRMTFSVKNVPAINMGLVSVGLDICHHCDKNNFLTRHKLVYFGL